MSALIPLAVVALVVATVMAWMAWRVLRDERARADARVAALAAELGAAPVRRPTSVRDAGEIELSRDGLTDTDGMFATTAQPSHRGVRWATAAVSGALVFGLAVAIVISFSLRARPRISATTSAATAATPAQPLELMSLRHERAADHLVIKGLVRNPAGGKAVNRISAVVFLFDRDGTFLTSGQALVDFLTLTPGEESPFVVEIPAPGSVGRYRVSFRNADGTVLPHVDRRQEAVSHQRSAVSQNGRKNPRALAES